MAKRILETNEEEINADEQERFSKKKIVLQFDDVQHFVFFQRFRISLDFLHKDPSLWEITTEHKEAKDIIATLKVVNDSASAERGIVQDYRKQYPGFSREVLKQTYNKME
ncbi:Uncharacterized protein FWK35_00036411 [Aphis craccivora]|uniref:Uncharacterized protein n=1 Tax=Aphis craccivora TaxID=307492 RepID=A0A6G0VMK5_APHCR|nr:Uncharacterized protein FWK35_00036411 [Aphis craccivora]